MALPLTSIVNKALVALPLSAGAATAAPAPNTDEVEYFMTLFEHYTQEQLAKELESSKKSRVVAALATAAARGQTFLLKFFKKKVEAGQSSEIPPMLEATAKAAEAATGSLATRLMKALREAGSAAYEALDKFYTWASAKAVEGGPKAKEWAGKAAAAFTAAPGVIEAAWYQLGPLSNIKGLRIIDARYGTPVLPGSLKLNANTNRFFLVDRYNEFKTDELKSELAKFSSKYSLSNATQNQLKGIVKKMMLEQANGRFIKNRYAGQIKKLISNENWNKIKKGETTLQQTLARIKLSGGNGNRVGRLNSRYTLAAAPPSVAPPSAAQQKSMTNIMSNAAFQDALSALIKAKPNFVNISGNIAKKAALLGSVEAGQRYIEELKSKQKLNVLRNIYGVRFNNQSRLEDLLQMRASRNYSTWPQEIRTKFNNTIRQKMLRRKNSISRENFDYESLSAIVKAINANQEGYVPGGADYVNTLKRAINRIGTSSNRLRVNENRLARITGAVRGVRKVTSVTNAIRNAQSRITRMRREANSQRRERGLAPLPVYNNRGSSRIPYYPTNVRPSSYGNMRPGFAPPPNRPQPGIVPMPPPLQPFPAIPANNRSPPRPENLLPPMEAAAVTNVGGINKAINLVENAGGPSNIVKTANILKTVGNNPNAAVAAGANAKNVRIVLQLGGANNALKVASAVPKLKKRRRSKKAKKAAPKPKAPRVKELKKLIKFLGTKEELVKKLPDPENKEKKLTKNQVVAKITTHLLRKGRGGKK